MSLPFPNIDKPVKPKIKLWKYILVIVTFLVILVSIKEYFEDYVIKKDDGSYELSPIQVQRLQRDTSKFNEVQQYVIVARINAWYPCLTCPDTTMIFLYKGEVWKYGVTINGEKIRYAGKNKLLEKNLLYFVEFEGEIGQCLKQERIKIINYPLLPENLKRKVKLAKPPYNPINN